MRGRGGMIVRFFWESRGWKAVEKFKNDLVLFRKYLQEERSD
jgi:hypothetical protein